MNRRDFFYSTAALGVLSAFTETKAQEAEAIADQKTYSFWKSQRLHRTRTRSWDACSALSTGIETFTASTDTPPGPALPTAKRPHFLYYLGPGQFVEFEDVPEDKLLKDGNAKINLIIDNFKPSQAEQPNLVNAVSGTLRIDMGQVHPQPGFDSTLAWSILHALFPNKVAEDKSTKTVRDDGVAWGTRQTLTLPGGAGFMKWNFFYQPQPSTWKKILDALASIVHLGADPKAALLMGTAFGVPAIAVAGLTVLDQVLATTQAKEAQSNFGSVAEFVGG